MSRESLWQRRHVRLALRGACLLVIVLATLTQLRTGGAPTALDVGRHLQRALDPRLGNAALVDALRNVALFTTWGAVWVITTPPGPALPMLRGATLTGALLSAAVEAIQLLSPVRTSSLLDVATNTFGALVGALALVLLVLMLQSARGARSFVGIPALLFAGGYGGAALLEAFMPIFRQDRVLGAWGDPFSRLGLALRAVEAGSIRQFPVGDVLLFLPAGAFALAAMAEAGVPYGRALVRVCAGGLAAVAVAEVARGFIGYTIELGPIAAHTLGIAAGAWLARRFLPRLTHSLRGAARPRLLLYAYAIVLLLWSWNPFYFEPTLADVMNKINLDRFIPLQAYRERFDVFTVADALAPALLFLPLGGLLAVWPLRFRGPLRDLLPALYLALLLETTQVVFAGRWFDVTDLLIQAAGGAVGWVVVRRAGFLPYGEARARQRSGGTRHRPVI